MENVLTEKLTEAIHALAEIIKADARHIAIVKASDEYSNNEELRKLLEEYSALQTAMAAEYEKEDMDEKAVTDLQTRMGEIYETVTAHPVYCNFKEASEAYEELTNEVYGELEFAVTGQRASECTHDCSTCGGGCSHEH